MQGETNIEPEPVAAAAVRLGLDVEELRGQLTEPVAVIQAASDEVVWGRDDPGQAFELSYYGTGGRESLESLLAGTEGFCDNVETLADNTGIGAFVTELADQERARQLQELADEAEDLHGMLMALAADGGSEAILTDQDALDQAGRLSGLAGHEEVAEHVDEGIRGDIEVLLDDIYDSPA